MEGRRETSPRLSFFDHHHMNAIQIALRVARRPQLFAVALAALACGGDSTPMAAPPQAPPAPPQAPPAPPPTATVLLKDIVIPELPSPYYHFDYDATGRVSNVSFASELTKYDVAYDGDRIKELQNNILVNHDRLVYAYDDAG